MPPAPKAHFETLDGLRGTAAFSVVAFHMAELATPDLPHDPLRHTGLAVDFFFALSGFVMAHAYDARLSRAAAPERRLTLWGFFLRRLIRLHPMVVAGMTLGLVSYLVDPFVGRIGGGGGWPMLMLVYGLSLLVLPEPNLPNRIGETHCLNSPAWSLFNEYIGNIVYGVVLHRLSARALAGLCVIAAVGLVAAVRPFSSIAQGWDLDYWWMGPVRLAYPFMAGMLVHRLRLSIRLPLAYVWLSVALIAIFTAPPMGPDNSVVEALCVIFVFPLVLILGAGQARIEGVIGRLCRFTGRLSYPLYMVHYPAIYIFAHWLWARHPSAPAVWIAGIGLYAGAIATAWLLMTFYDEPLRAWLTRRLEGQQPPPASQRALG